MHNLIHKIWHTIGGIWGLLTIALFTAAVAFLHAPIIEKLDGVMFAIDAQFVAKPDKIDDIAVIKIPRTYTSSTSQLNHRLLITLLDELKTQNALALALVLNVNRTAHLNALNSAQYIQELEAALKALPADKRQNFIDVLNFEEQELFSENILIKSLEIPNLYIAQQVSGTETLQFNKQLAISKKTVGQTTLRSMSWFQESVLPSLSNIDNAKVLELAYNNLPAEVGVTDTAYRSLLWSVDNQLMPDILSQLYAKLVAGKTPLWRSGQGLDFATDFRPTDWVGRVLPRSSVFTNIKVDYQEISYIDVLNKNPITSLKDKVVILGFDDDLVVDDLAMSLSSLSSGSVYYSPVWTDTIVLGLLCGILIYSLLLLPKLQTGVGVLLTLFLLFALLVGQMGLLLIKLVWAPLTMVVLFLIAAHLLSMLRKKIETRFEQLEKQVFEAFWMLGVYQYEQGEYDQSFASLQKCPTTEPMLEQMYRIGQAYEKRRQYTKALDLYRELHTRRPGYKSAEKRIKSLVQLEQNANSSTSSFSAARTLIVTNHGLQKPVLGRYELMRELGRGAMGVVYLGKDPKINRQVAIKTMDLMQYGEDELPLVRERFFKEAETAGRLSHPNIVTIYDVGDEQDLAFIAMDYVIGQVMSDFVRKGRLLPIDMVFKLMRQVAIALDYAHKQGVVHRDIKPSNIMYNTEEQIIKVTDFGIARAAGVNGTNTGSILGSPLYMAPEQLSGIAIDGRADLFSLGVSMYQLLTGELPFQGDNLASLAYQVTNVKHQPIREHRSELPVLTTRLINKLLQKDVDKRFSSGKEVAAAIIKVLSTMEDVPLKRVKKAD